MSKSVRQQRCANHKINHGWLEWNAFIKRHSDFYLHFDFPRAWCKTSMQHLLCLSMMIVQRGIHFPVWGMKRDKSPTLVSPIEIKISILVEANLSMCSWNLHSGRFRYSPRDQDFHSCEAPISPHNEHCLQGCPKSSIHDLIIERFWGLQTHLPPHPSLRPMWLSW